MDIPEGQFSIPPFYDLQERRIHRSPLMINIIIFDNKTDNQIREHKKNFRKTATRQWLNDVLLWAVNHDCTVEISNAE